MKKYTNEVIVKTVCLQNARPDGRVIYLKYMIKSREKKLEFDSLMH